MDVEMITVLFEDGGTVRIPLVVFKQLQRWLKANGVLTEEHFVEYQEIIKAKAHELHYMWMEDNDNKDK